MVAPEELVGLVFILSIGAIFFYSIGRFSASYQNKKELKSMTDKVNYALEKYSDKTPKQKELSVLNYEAECIKKHIEECKKQLVLDDISISFKIKAKEELQKKIDIEKCKLMLVNTEIQNYKKK